MRGTDVWWLAFVAAHGLDPNQVLKEICPGNPVIGPEHIPHQVFYTGAFDPNLQVLSAPNYPSKYTTNGWWPSDYQFHYYDNDAVDASMRKLDTLLELRANVTGAYYSFTEVLPFAFKADLWRYCVLWACGGIYLDAKMALTVNFTTFANMAFKMHDPSKGKALYTCDSTYGKKWGEGIFVWQGLLISEAWQPDLLAVIQDVVSNVKAHAYAEDNDRSHMFAITGPMAFGVAVGRRRGWKERVHLPCDKKYLPNVLTTSRFRQATQQELKWLAHNDSAVPLLDLEEVVLFDGDNEKIHEGLRGHKENFYGTMYIRHKIYAHYTPKSEREEKKPDRKRDDRKPADKNKSDSNKQQKPAPAPPAPPPPAKPGEPVLVQAKELVTPP